MSLFDQTLQQFYGGPVAAPSFQQPVRSAIRPLEPQEESTVLDRIGGGALSGLGYIGGSLSKAFGGRALRGLIGGKPEEALSIIPFSDTLGITDPSNEVRGSELLGNKDADFLSPEGIGGLALDIGLDPATYLSFGGGALTHLGDLAKAKGVLPSTVAGRVAGLAAGTPEADTLARALAGTSHAMGPVAPEQLAQVAGKTLGGHMGVGLPFGGNAATFDLSGAGNALKQGLGAIPGGQSAMNLVHSAIDPLRRGGRALFDKSVGGQTDPFLQDVIANRYSAKVPEMMVQTRQDVRPLVEMAHEGNLLNPAGGRTLGNVLEGATPVTAETAPIAGHAQDLFKKLQQEQLDALLPVRQLTPQTIRTGEGAGNALEYAPRQLAREEFTGGGGRAKVLQPSVQEARVIATEGMTRSRLEDLAKEDMTGLSPLQVHERIRTEYLGLPPSVQVDVRDMRDLISTEKANAAAAEQTLTAAREMAARKQLAPDLALAAQQAEQRLAASQKTIQATTEKVTEYEARMAQAQDLAKYKIEGKTPVFNHPVEDVITKVFKDRDRALKADAFHYGVAGLAVSKDEAGPGAMTFLEALQRGGLAPEGDRLMLKTQQALESMGKAPADMANMYIRKEDLNPLMRWMEGTRTPAGLQPFVDVWDTLTNVTKAWQTAVWPANWSRNFMTDQFMNWVHEGSIGGNYLKSLTDAKVLHQGGMLADANMIPMFHGLPPDVANKELQRLIVDQGVVGHGRLLSDTLGEVGEGVRVKDLLPGQAKPGLIEGYKKAFSEGTLNPLDVRGVGGRLEDTNKLVSAGRVTNESLSDITRIQTFLAKLHQGYSPAEALKVTNLAHYDFANLTGFERDVLRRVIPFYSWARQNIPSVLTEMATKPGGRLASVVKASGEARGAEPGFLPPQIADVLALPLGPEDETGTKRFLSHTGLPFEDLSQIASAKGVLGSLNPMIKAPLELATGKQFFTGRDLRDLHSDTGSTLLDQAMANSPFGRVASTVRTLADERKDAASKAFNLLSGAHLTDIDMPKARNVAVRDYISNQLIGSPNIGTYSDLFVRPDQVANLSPAELLMLRLKATRDAETRRLAGRR